MVTIEYDPYNGTPVADGRTEFEVGIILNCIERKVQPLVRVFSTENIFNALRLAILNTPGLEKKILFKYGDKIININKYGAILDWPNGFLSKNIDYAYEILKGGLDKKRGERENGK